MICEFLIRILVSALFLQISAASGAFPNVEVEGIRVRYFTGVNDNVTVEAEDGIRLLIVCHDGEEQSALNIWKTVCVRIISPSKDYSIFVGENETMVADAYKASMGLLNFIPSWQLPNRVDLLVYNKSCVGFHSSERYRLLLEIYCIDFWKVLRLLTGLTLFFAAPYLSGNVVFYYSSGITLGICASLLIIVFILSRFIPKKIGAMGFLVGGCSFAVYLIQIFVANLKWVMARYQGLVLLYLVVVGFGSFAVCYKRGHVTDVRTRNLIKWGLQGVALLMIFLSTEWHEVGFSFMLISIAVHAFPNSWRTKLQVYWKRRFPPKVKLLTEEEYYHQAVVETRKALENLRSHCQSPACKSWTMMRKLRTPLRFAEFIEGDSHLTDDEILNYEVEQSSMVDDDDDSFSDPEIPVQTTPRHNGYASFVRG